MNAFVDTFWQHHINSWRPDDSYICQWTRFPLVQVGFFLLFGANPLNSLQCRQNGRDGVSNHQPYDCLLNRLFRRRSEKTPKLRVTGLCEGNSLVTGEFSAQRASNNAENVSLWWRHHVGVIYLALWGRDNMADIFRRYIQIHFVE